MIIYWDVFLIKNFIFNYLLLYLTSLIIRKKVKKYRIILASIFGSLYALLALYNKSVFEVGILKIIIPIIMLVITYGTKDIIKMSSVFIVVSYFVSGMIASLLNVNSQIILLLYGVASVIIFYFYNKAMKKNKFYEVEIELYEKQLNLCTKLDTGNELCDSIFGDPVIVVSEEKVKKQLGTELIKILNNERLEIPELYKNRIKLISFKTISGEGIKIGIKLDRIIISTENQKIESKAILILSDRRFKNYDALIGENLLEGGYIYEDISFNKIKDTKFI